jgi:hypothetical protein
MKALASRGVSAAISKNKEFWPFQLCLFRKKESDAASMTNLGLPPLKSLRLPILHHL